MAFVFNKINDEVDQQGQNVFGGQQQQQEQQQQGGQQQQGAGGGTVQKTATTGEGLVGGGEGKQGGETGRPESRDILKNEPPSARNQGFVKQAFQSAKETRQQLQNKAQEFVQNQQGPQTFSEQDVQQAVQTGNLQGLSEFLGQTEYDIERPDFNVNTGIENLRAMQTRAGRQGLYAQAGGPTYTSGMGALDEILFRRSPQFQQVMSQLQQEQVGLGQAEQAAEARAEKQAEAAGLEALQAGQEQVRGTLGTLASGIEQGLEEQLSGVRASSQEAYQAQKTQAMEKMNQIIGDQLAKVNQAIADAEAFGLSGPDVEQLYRNRENLLELQANAANNTFREFTDPNYQSFTREDVVTPEQAQQFNNIMQLLGRPDRIQASGRQIEDASITLNEQALLDKVSKYGVGNVQEQIELQKTVNKMNEIYSDVPREVVEELIADTGEMAVDFLRYLDPVFSGGEITADGLRRLGMEGTAEELQAFADTVSPTGLARSLAQSFQQAGGGAAGVTRAIGDFVSKPLQSGVGAIRTVGTAIGEAGTSALEGASEGFRKIGSLF